MSNVWQKIRLGISTKIRSPLLTILLCLLVLVACNYESSYQELLKDDITVTIAYYSEENFRKRYGDLLNLEYPELDYHIVSEKQMIQNEVSVEAWMKSHQADIMYIPFWKMQDFVDQNQLLDLTPYVRDNDLDLSTMSPGILEAVKNLGSGKIYGLPPTFVGKVLVYNQSIFDQQTILYPDDEMTWTQLMDTASRFSDQGLLYPAYSQFEFLYEIGVAQGLHLYRENPVEVSFDSASWVEFWERMIPPMQEGRIKPLQTSILNEFMKGESAMAVIDYYEYLFLRNSDVTFDWSIRSLPTNPQNPNSSKLLIVDGFYAIPARTENVKPALELMKYFLSEEVARWEDDSVYGISTMIDANPDAFVRSFIDTVPDFQRDPVPYSFLEIGEQAYQEISTGGKSVPDALKVAQQQAIDSIKTIDGVE